MTHVTQRGRQLHADTPTTPLSSSPCSRSTKTYLKLKVENLRLKQELEQERLKSADPQPQPRDFSSCDIRSFKDDDAKLSFFTGLTCTQFMALFKFLGPPSRSLVYWNGQRPDAEETPTKPKGSDRVLSPENELLLTLIRLRLGLLHRHLAYMFGISQTTVVSIIITWVRFMHAQFKRLDHRMLPRALDMKGILPRRFKKFHNIRIILGCIEIFCVQSKKFCRQDNKPSGYKHHSTFKVLVGMTPNGTFGFISEPFEGAITDRDVVVQSGLLNKLDRGDLVIADGRFPIRDLLNAKEVHLNIPPGLHGRSHGTSQKDVEAKALARSRTLVAGAIGKLKKFRLLGKVMPLSLSPIASSVVFVCACLVNFQQPTVK